jgi:hypothetical protein
MTKFEINKAYGNDFTIEIISRTEKTITFKSVFGIKRVKIRQFYNEKESISFKCWLICSEEIFNKKEAAQLQYEKAYY